jgi:hypothetical protein
VLGPKTGAAIAMFALVASGCRTVGGMRTAPLSEGVQRSYDADYGDVKRAAYEAVYSLGLKVEEVNQIDSDTLRVIATAGVSAFSWGELVRVSVQRYPAMPVSVWVLTRRRIVTNFTAKGDYSPDIFQRMDFKLTFRHPGGWYQNSSEIPPAGP